MRATITCKPVDEDPEDIRIKGGLDEISLKDPCPGSRRLVTVPGRDDAIKTDRERIVRLRREIGEEVNWHKPRTRIPDDGDRKYPDLFRNLVIERPNQGWGTDITCERMPRGHAYLCAGMDWKSREVLGWALSNTMGTELCMEASEMALSSNGKIPEIFRTDQGCQFTSAEWTGRSADLGVKISMDGKGRWMDNVFIERL